MKKHLYLMPVMALSLASFALAGCDDKKDDTVAADTAAADSIMPPAADTSAATTTETSAATEAGVVVSDAHAFATAPGATNGAVFATISNPNAEADFLSGAKSDVASSVEIHQTYMDPQTNTMLMRPTSGVDVAPSGSLALEPNGYHIMLVGLSKPLTEGESFNVTLTFRNAGDIVVPVMVTAPGATMDHSTLAPADATATDATATASPDDVVAPEASPTPQDGAPAETEGATETEPTVTTPVPADAPTSQQ